MIMLVMQVRCSIHLRHLDHRFSPTVRLKRALDAPFEFWKLNVYFLRLPVCNVVLDLQHERPNCSEFARGQFQFGQLFQYGPHLRLPLRLCSI